MYSKFLDIKNTSNVSKNYDYYVFGKSFPYSYVPIDRHWIQNTFPYGFWRHQSHQNTG